jgi:hypothetical protein
MKYTCKECGSPVELDQTTNKIIRPYCSHEDSGVVASLIATVYGIGGMEKMLVKNVDE